METLSKVSFRKISWRIEAARLVVWIIVLNFGRSLGRNDAVILVRHIMIDSKLWRLV